MSGAGVTGTRGGGRRAAAAASGSSTPPADAAAAGAAPATARGAGKRKAGQANAAEGAEAGAAPAAAGAKGRGTATSWSLQPLVAAAGAAAALHAPAVAEFVAPGGASPPAAAAAAAAPVSKRPRRAAAVAASVKQASADADDTDDEMDAHHHHAHMSVNDDEAGEQREDQNMQREVMAASAAANAASAGAAGAAAAAAASAAAAQADMSALFPGLPQLPLPGMADFPLLQNMLPGTPQMLQQMQAWFLAQPHGMLPPMGIAPPLPGAAAAAGAASPRKGGKSKVKQEQGLVPSGAGMVGGVPPVMSFLNFAHALPQQQAVPASINIGAGDCLLSSIAADWQLHVFSYLTGRDISVLSRTSKYFHAVTSQPRVWKPVCQSLARYPCPHSSHPWRELFLTRVAKLRDKFRPQAQRQYKKKHYFVCSHCECTKGFESEALLTNHVELRHGPNRARPPIPSYRPPKMDMSTGLVLQRIGSTYPCPVQGCAKQFNKAIELKYHFDGVHKQSRAFPCDWAGCYKSFVSPAQLNLHRCKHTGAPRPHMCKYPDCRKTFNTPSQVAKHAQSHLRKEDRVWLPCTVAGCKQVYATQSAIKKHIATAHDPSLLRFRCSDPTLMSIFLQPGPAFETALSCPAAFFTKATWVEHLRAKHGIDPSHPQLMEVVRIMRGLPQLPAMPVSIVQAMQAQAAHAAAAQMGGHASFQMMLAAQAQAHQQAQMAAQGGTPQQNAASAVAQAVAAAAQAAAAAGGLPLPAGGVGGPMFMAPAPGLPALPTLMAATTPLGNPGAYPPVSSSVITAAFVPPPAAGAPAAPAPAAAASAPPAAE